MQSHSFKQGDADWHAHRATHLNASDAPAMLDCSPYMSRAELLRRMHTGVSAEVDAGTKRRFDDGHRFEALARPLGEKIVGEELYPVTGSIGELSASFDGLTLLEETAFEHKTLNDELRACMTDEGAGHALPKHYRVQMEQQLLVSGAERVLFMATKWTPSGELVEERHCWYEPDPALRAELVAGWKQFAQDLAAYVPPTVAEVVTAAPIEALPAVSVQMQGSLAVHSNLDVFGAKLRVFIATIPAKPSSEQEFADCDAACKALKRAEEALDGAEANALGQVQSVEQVTRTIADLRTIARTARLASEKVVKARKEQIRVEEVQRGRDALAKFIVDLNTTIGKPYMPAIVADFAGVISGKKTVDSVRNAIDAELARAKIAANAIAGTITINLRALREQAEDFKFLFHDTPALVLKAADDCQAVITSRIAEHKAAEAKRLEAEREAIRVEEQAKAEKAAREKLAAEQAERDAQARRDAEAAKPAPTPAPAPIAVPAGVTPAAATFPPGYLPLTAALAPSPAANVVPMGTRAPAAPASQPTLKLGQIGERLGFSLPADFLKQLGFEPAARDRSALLFHESSFDFMCESLKAHITTVQAKQQKAA